MKSGSRKIESALIVITGFMGSGKSTVARALASRLGSTAIDLDSEILKRDGRTAQQIIEEEDEPTFRYIETRILRDVLQDKFAGVISLGGGAWVLERNRDLIAAAKGISVWLDAPFDLCWQRILSGDAGRPLAKTKQEALDLYNKRRDAYAKASLRVEATRNRTADEIAGQIVEALDRL
jgi:shikimate kinase